MITLDRAYRLLDSGYSLATVDSNKQGNFSWKDGQNKQITKEELAKRYNYQGGITLKDGREMNPTADIALITGFNGLEVIDIDLKVFSTLPEQNDFWNELHNYIKDNIDDFELKFVIYKTRNKGYHILYRCDNPSGNTKIAVLEGHKQAVIESRGVGGYVIAYENKISKLDYTEIQTISTQDRDLLWQICKTFHYIAPSEDEPKNKKPHSEVKGITPWDDYNARHTIWDVISDDFKVVRKMAKHTIIVRHGASSSTSGYVYNNSGCMYLFSTGTIYPHEKLLSPYAAFVYKYHNGNFKDATKELYNAGYGARVVKESKVNESEIVIPKDTLIFPIDIFPLPIQNYIIQCNKTLSNSIDYMGCSMLWALSVSIGNSVHIEVKKGWEEIGCVWIAIVGKAGLGKTPSINSIIKPLLDINTREVKLYLRHYDKWLKYSKLSESDKKNVEHIEKPVNTQFIANDITLEALVNLHQESKNSVGVFKDELNGWFKDMNKYRAGSDLEFWLSTWSGKSVSMNRKTAGSAFVDKPFLPVLGGIQPSILETFYTSENKDNGFVDRMLLTFPELQIDDYNDLQMEYDVIQWYNDFMTSFYDFIKSNYVMTSMDNDILPCRALLSEDARTEWKRIFNEISYTQNSDEENEYMKSMLPKQKGYIPRFALLIHMFNSFANGHHDLESMLLISKDSMLKAEKLSKYFIAMAKKIKVNSIEMGIMKEVINNSRGRNAKEKFLEMYQGNPKLNQGEAAELLGVSRRTVVNWLKELRN